MVADGMLTRKRYREVPPRVDYELTERSRDLAPVLGELARWGYEWAWSSPRASECIDIGAIFRLTPGLITGSGIGSRGTVQLIVADGRDGDPATYLVTFRPDGATIAEGSDDTADAVLHGTGAAWIQALAPTADRGGLTTTGDIGLAARLLDSLALGAGHEAADFRAEPVAG
jgi:hypothetical protein